MAEPRADSWVHSRVVCLVARSAGCLAEQRAEQMVHQRVAQRVARKVEPMATPSAVYWAATTAASMEAPTVEKRAVHSADCLARKTADKSAEYLAA